MNFFKNIWNKIKTPHGIWLRLFYVFFVLITSGTIILVVLVPKQTIFHYILYAIATAALTYFVYTVVIFAPRIKSNTIQFLQNHKFTNKLLEDYGYRTIIFAVLSFILNVAFISLILVVAVISKTAWYYTIATYYIVLALMKGNVFHSKLRHGTEVKQAKALRFSGIMFVIMTIVFSGVIVLIYKANHYFEYAGILIYIVAVFTFYKLILAIFNIFKARKQDDLYIENIRNINLASALISIIILQVAMFQAFAPEHNLGFANALTGAGVSAIILLLGVFMIIKANKRLKSLNKNTDNIID